MATRLPVVVAACAAALAPTRAASAIPPPGARDAGAPADGGEAGERTDGGVDGGTDAGVDGGASAGVDRDEPTPGARQDGAASGWELPDVEQPRPPPAAAKPVRPRRRRVTAPPTGDPNRDRGFLAPTAMTQPGGSVAFSDWELFLLGSTIGLHDNLQLSLYWLPSVFSGEHLLGATLKARLPLGPRVHVAPIAGYVTGEGSGVTLLGIAASLCVDESCASPISASAQRMFDGSSSGDRTLDMVSLSALVSVGANVKLVAEIVDFAESRSNDYIVGSIAVLDYGVRICAESVALDLGFMLSDEFGKVFPAGFPFFAFSVRVR